MENEDKTKNVIVESLRSSVKLSDVENHWREAVVATIDRNDVVTAFDSNTRLLGEMPLCNHIQAIQTPPGLYKVVGNAWWHTSVTRMVPFDMGRHLYFKNSQEEDKGDIFCLFTAQYADPLSLFISGQADFSNPGERLDYIKNVIPGIETIPIVEEAGVYLSIFSRNAAASVGLLYLDGKIIR